VQPEKEVVTTIHQLGAAAMFAAIGVLIGIGQVLMSKDVITPRLIIGRCISTGGIAMCAGAALAVFPDLPLVAQIGIAAMLASLGSSGLELLIQRILGRG